MQNIFIYFHAACGQATLTIPGTNITIPLGNVTSQVSTANQASQQPQQQQQQTNQSANQQQQQNQQQNQTQAQAQSQQPVTITIPGTNIQIPTSVAAANGLISTSLKVDSAGKIIFVLQTLITNLLECL